MKAISRVEGRAYPVGLKNIDTDVIIPAVWLKTRFVVANPLNLFVSLYRTKIRI